MVSRGPRQAGVASKTDSHWALMVLRPASGGVAYQLRAREGREGQVSEEEREGGERGGEGTHCGTSPQRRRSNSNVSGSRWLRLRTGTLVVGATCVQ